MSDKDDVKANTESWETPDVAPDGSIKYTGNEAQRADNRTSTKGQRARSWLYWFTRISGLRIKYFIIRFIRYGLVLFLLFSIYTYLHAHTIYVRSRFPMHESVAGTAFYFDPLMPFLGAVFSLTGIWFLSRV